MLALEFFNPWLLLGLLAAAIPFVLHLLSSVRAQEAPFPTLRFLRISMEKTARRRRIQHWLLLLVRAALLAILCIGVAEPITKAAGGFSGRSGFLAALILDNSYSMAATDQAGSRLDRAKSQAADLLGGDDMPAQAALLTTAGGAVSKELTNRLDTLRDGLAKTAVGYGPSPLAQRFTAAMDCLDRQTAPRKAIYIFSDLQRSTFEELLASPDLARAKDVHVFIINTAPNADKVVNVGIADLEIAGRRVVDSSLEFTARLVNSSATARAIDVGMRLDGGDAPIGRMRVNLAPAGRDGSIATARFYTQFAKPGPVSGQVYIEQADDLPIDNVRRFSMDIGPKAGALVVRGPRAADDAAWMDSGAWLQLALQPYGDANNPWPITSRLIDADKFAPADLASGLDAVFFSDVPSFNPAQADAIAKFVKGGGTAVFFLGPNTQADNYNQLLAGGAEPILPAKLAAAVGAVDPTAPAQQVTWLDINHPYFAKLWANPADYLSQAVQVQRYFQLAAPPASTAVLVKLRDGQPLLLVGAVGAGHTVLCTTTASPRWGNLPNTPLFLPLVNRMTMLARQDAWRDGMYTAGSQATIRLGPPAGDAIEAAISQPEVRIALPSTDADGEQRVATVKAANTAEGLAATFTDTAAPGLYRWTSGGKTGQFVVNPAGAECRLETIGPAELQQALASRGLKHIYIGQSVAKVAALADKDAQGRNWWDLAVAAAIFLLVFEAVIANRRKLAEQAAGTTPT